MKNKYIIVTHAVLSEDEDIAGPAHNIVKYLDNKNADYLFIRHSLFQGNKTLVSSKKNGRKDEYKLDSYSNFGELIGRLAEGFRTLQISYNFFKTGSVTYLGIDPLNSLWGLVLKKTGRVNSLISFTVDYSPKRFENRLFNSLYHFLDRLALRYSDKAWAVSGRIYDLRIKQGKMAKDLLLVPNAPAIKDVRNLVKKNTSPFNLITIGTISMALDFTLIVEVLDELQKKFPKVKLTIIGGGKGMNNLKDFIKRKKLTGSITLPGSMSHEEVFKILSNHGIGIAIYTDNAPWSFYSDSMKARDYLALGLPVVISGNIGTAEEIEKNSAGIVVKKNLKSIAGALEKLLTDQSFYFQTRKNAINLAKRSDIERILDRALE